MSIDVVLSSSSSSDPSPSPSPNADRVWTALAHPARRHLLELLRDRPRTVSELCREFVITRYAVMKHLAVLREAGLLRVQKDGRRRWNHLEVGPLHELAAHWFSRYSMNLARSSAEASGH